MIWIRSLLLSLFLFAFVPSCLAGTVVNVPMGQMVLVPQQQLIQLETDNNFLMGRLEMLYQLTETLNISLTKQQQELMECKKDLIEARNSLNQAKSKLKISEESLLNAKMLQAMTEQSLNNLEKEIIEERKQYRAEIRRHKWQKAIAYTITCVALGTCVF